MSNSVFLRLSVNVCYWACCTTCKRRVCVTLGLLALLTISAICLHSLNRGSRRINLLSEDEEEPHVDLSASRQLNKFSRVIYNDNGNIERYVSSKPRDPKRRRFHDRHPPCSNLTSGEQRGPIEADVLTFPGMKALEAELADGLQLGGHHIPSNCRPSQKVAVIVPFRDRETHLEVFLKHMHPFLQRQQIEYYIVVIEQAEGTPFNRALLFNIGFYKMNKLHDIDCYIFHDVDLLPLDDRIGYLCQEQPLHLSMLVDTLGNELMYENLFGGVVALTPEMMETVNGFPNLYFGWGGEDDDMSYRIRHHGYSIDRYSKEVARYTMMRHGREEAVDQGKLNKKVETGKLRLEDDGLNTLVFHLLEFQPLPLYTWILVRPNSSMLNGENPVPRVTDILA